MPDHFYLLSRGNLGKDFENCDFDFAYKLHMLKCFKMYYALGPTVLVVVAQ